MLDWLKKSRGILGMNARNLHYIRPHNLEGGFRIADNKLLTKKILQENNIPVPQIYGTITNRKKFNDFDWKTLPDTFVVKPNLGFAGQGVMVIFGRGKDGTFIGSHGRITHYDLLDHISNILDGNYSLYSTPDVAFFEERLKITKELKSYAHQGVPDIRVIVFNKVPVMAELRLPTKFSKGRANLHQGGIGVGIDIGSGVTTTAIMWDKVIEYVPESRLRLRGIRIPRWTDILTMAVRTQMATGLGYAGVDIALDRDRGPVILELNARPGLAIQIANLTPLKERLRRVKGLTVTTAEKGVRLAKEIFGGEIEHEIEEITGRPLIGIVEKVEVHGKDQSKQEGEVRIDTGALFSSISTEWAKKLGYQEALDVFERYKKEQLEKGANDFEKFRDMILEKHEDKNKEVQALHPDLMSIEVIRASNGVSIRPTLQLKVTLAQKIFTTKVTVAERSHLTYPMIIGRKDLRQFIVDPSKSKPRSV